MISPVGVWILIGMGAAVAVWLSVAILFAITGWDVGRTSLRRPRRYGHRTSSHRPGAHENPQ